jgi:dipeptidyl aminopeptidase/acylaminoacyl peptidase
LIDLKEKKRVKKCKGRAFVFSPTADVAYLITKAHIEVLELPGLKTARKIEVGHARRLAVSPDGKTLAALTRTPLDRPTGGYRDELVVFDAAGAVRIRYETESRYETEAMSLAFSPDGKRLATGHWRGGARVWSAVEKGEPQRLKVERSYGLFPLWFDNDTLGLLLPDREQGSTDPEQWPTWTDMYLCDLSRGEPEAVRWRFENAPNRTFVTGRYALSADRQLLLAASNGLSVIDLKERKVERTFPGWKELAPKK